MCMCFHGHACAVRVHVTVHGFRELKKNTRTVSCAGGRVVLVGERIWVLEGNGGGLSKICCNLTPRLRVERRAL